MAENRSQLTHDAQRIAQKHHAHVEIRLVNGKAVRIHYDENGRQIKEEDAGQEE